MYEYTHGGNALFEGENQGIIDLSANINPLGVPSAVLQAITDEFVNLSSYPDSSSTKLRQSIANYEQLYPDWVFCGNGASDIIFRLPRAIKARKVLVTAPTFSDYERAALSYGAQVTRHKLLPADGFQVTESLINEVEESRPDLVFICNPNNPTGAVTSSALIKQLLHSAKQQNTYVVIDECFMDFVIDAASASSVKLLEQYPNLLILKAFTKIFALPGIRLGYALTTNSQLIEGLYYHGSDWPVSNLAQAAGIAALSDAQQYICEAQSFVREQRQSLQSGLVELGFQVFPSQANYVFIKNPHPFDLAAELNHRGIRIRSCANYHGLADNYYRIAVSNQAHNELLLQTIHSIINEQLSGQKSDQLHAEEAYYRASQDGEQSNLPLAEGASCQEKQRQETHKLSAQAVENFYTDETATRKQSTQPEGSSR